MPAIIDERASLGAILIGCFVAIACVVAHPLLPRSIPNPSSYHADSLELSSFRHASTFERTQVTGHWTKLRCAIFTLSARNAHDSRRSVGCCGLVSYEILVQATWHAKRHPFMKLQDSRYLPQYFYMLFCLGLSHCKLWERGGVHSGRCSNVSQPRYMPTTHYLTSYGTQIRFSA